MRKTNIVLGIALTLAVLTGLTLNQVSGVSAQGDSPVGLVIVYIPGQTITIVDEKGIQSEYGIDPSVKILPPEKASSLGVGSFVTIIAPASISKGKQTAVGIVIQPDVPKGLKIPGWAATPLVKDTAVSTLAAVTEPQKVLAVSATPIVKDTAAPTSTPTDLTEPQKVIEQTTPAATTKGGGTAPKTNAFIEWLRSLLQQLLTSS
jgi:hypothetical protein